MMSQQQYHNIISSLFREKRIFTSLRAKLEGRREREYWKYKGFSSPTLQERRERKGETDSPK